MTDTIDAQSLLQIQTWLGAQTRTVAFAKANNCTFDSDSKNFQNVINTLSRVARVWKMPVLRHITDELVDLHNRIAAGNVSIQSSTVEQYIGSLQKARNFLPEAVRGNFILLIPDNAAPIADFGDVAAKLPSITADLEEAVACFNTARFTATVFHLMRAIEASLRVFGKKLKINIDADQANWYQIIQHVNRAIDQLPNRTSAQSLRKQSYGVVSAHLNAVRIAWRNEVMHPKASYASAEAADILVHSKALIRSVIDVL
ncbi:hypothetical protein [Sphingomonas sp. NFX23]|uniref:hypothetical protein n=1 Tax=Sphingomonas sp. NFX23 TaxID=2819532 RepID=UPI003CF773BE